MTRALPMIAVIGGGNMASAIVQGCVRAGLASAHRFLSAEPDAAKRAAFARGFETAAEAIEALQAEEPLRGEGVVLLAVKPQMLAAVGAELGEALSANGAERCVISILAGMPGARVREALGGGARVVRVMPNTPARVGAGMTAIAASAGARDDDVAVARMLFESLGDVAALDESLIDAFTGVAGSGPAYVFYLAEAMARGGEAVGLDPATAARCTRQTIIGAAELLRKQPDISAADLRAAVTSKGGTTQAATEALDEAGVMEGVVEAIRAARDRGRALGG